MAFTRSFCDYTIGNDAYTSVAPVCRLYGRRILLVGGEKALRAGQAKLAEALAESELTLADVVQIGGECTRAGIHRAAQQAKACGADMIFGMGGGKALDTAKGAAHEAGLPVFTFPTIAATCAATTALSVVYREDGNFDCFFFYDRPAQHCFIDPQIIADAPAQYLQAGMGDTIGKHFECHFSARGDRLEHSSALGREISNLCYEPLREYGRQALQDCTAHRATPALEQAVLANIVSTGLVSLTVLDQYNGAIAHSVYYGLVLLPGFEEKWLHGNVVAYGVLVQLAVDGDTAQALQLKEFLQQLHIPTTLREMGVPVQREALAEVLAEIVRGPDMEHIPYPVTEDMIFRAMQTVEEY
jgi:glycerol dehydrogenase